MPSIGYTIVGGFLGAGKTTLINGLLASATERIAVVVNDLGDVNIDAALVASRTDDAVELTNGCVCCSVGDSLATTLRDLCSRDAPPERIVVECSGAADPGRVAAYGSRRLMSEPTVVVVADATDVRRRADDIRFASLVRAQLASADLMVVTKDDLVDDAAGVVAWLRDASSAVIVVGHSAAAGVVFDGTLVGLADNRGLVTTGSDASSVFSTSRRSFPAPIEVDEVARWLESIDGLVRAKGVVDTDTGPVLIQWAAGRFSTEAWVGTSSLRTLVTITANEPARG